MRKEWTNIKDGLPNKLMVVKLQFKTRPHMCYGAQKYYFDPTDNTFRTPKWKDVTKRVFAWIER